MASTYSADAATEALIAQLMAEDFGEVYEDHMRPIGSHYGDYEAPLSSYERACLENPDVEDGGGWNPPTPKYEPADAPELPEGETWDCSINNDPRIEAVPARISSRVEELGDDGSEGGVKLECSPSNAQTSTDIQAEAEETVPKLSRRATLPTQKPSSPTVDSRRTFSDPEPLNNDADPPQPDVTSSVLSKPEHPDAHQSLPIIHKPIDSEEIATSPPPFLPNPFAHPLSTNERLLNLLKNPSIYPDDRALLDAVNELNLPLETLEALDSTIDTSSAKNKGKAPVTDTDTEPDKTTDLNERMQSLMLKYQSSIFYSRRHGRIFSSSTKNNGKGKAKETSEQAHSDSSDDDSGPDDDSIDEKTGMLFLRVPWPESGRRDREVREAMDARVDEIWVGEGETLDSILEDMRERDEVRSRPWGSWGDEAVGGVGGCGLEGKGKGKAIEC